mmetsp:Transcript_586/g.1648  ORF Transcript_586/g.1648 Transcript_586/m.1648 type:complete len:203 (-) Transcript_586:509-1117(-)
MRLSSSWRSICSCCLKGCLHVFTAKIPPLTRCLARCVTPHQPLPRGCSSATYCEGGWCGGKCDTVELDDSLVANQDTWTLCVTESSQLRAWRRKPPLPTLSTQVSIRACAPPWASTPARASATPGMSSNSCRKLTSTYLSTPSLMGSLGHAPICSVPLCSSIGELLAIHDSFTLLATEDSQVPHRSAKSSQLAPALSTRSLR